jgi:WD40 repeat protein
MTRILFVLLVICLLGFTQSVSGQTQPSTVVTAVDWSEDGGKIAVVGVEFYRGLPNGYLHIYDAKTFSVLASFYTSPGGYASLDWSPDGRYLALGGYNTAVEIFDVEQERITQFLMGHQMTVNAVDWNADGTRLVSVGTTDMQLILWDMQTYQKIRTIRTIDPWDVTFSPDHQLVIVGGDGVELFPSDLNVPEQPIQRREQYAFTTGYIASLVWSPDGEYIAFGNMTFDRMQAEIKIVNRNGTIIRVIETGHSAIYSLDWSDDGTIIASYSEQAVQIWDAASGVLLETYPSVNTHAHKLGFSPYGGRLVFGNRTEGDYLALTTVEAQRLNPQVTQLAGGAIFMVVPHPTLERLNAIAESCLAPEIGVASVSDETRLPEFVTAIEALSDDQIPPGCKADLLAVAQAIQATE